MKKSVLPRKTPQQARSRQTRDDILQAATRLLNRKPFGEVSTNHIAKKTGISIGTLYKYYPNKDAILADLSLRFMEADAKLFGEIFERHASDARQTDTLIGELVGALIASHRDDAQVRGVVYQNLERLKLVGPAQSATRRIHASGAASMPGVDPALAWVAITTINAAVHSMSQLPKERQHWAFTRKLVEGVLQQVIVHRTQEG